MFFALNIFGGNAPYLRAFRWSFGGFPLLREAGVECFFLPKAKKHSHSRESGNLPVLLIVLGVRCRKTVRDSGRFPLSREWKGGGEWKGGREWEREGNGDEGRRGHSPMGLFADGGYLPMRAFADGAIRQWEHSPTNARMFFCQRQKNIPIPAKAGISLSF